MITAKIYKKIAIDDNTIMHVIITVASRRGIVVIVPEPLMQQIYVYMYTDII